MKFVVWVAAGLLLLSPALAANSTKSSLVAQILTKRLEADAATRVKSLATVNRSGYLKIVGVVQNLSGVSGPIIAAATFEVLGNGGEVYLEQGTATVAFKGKIGKFTIKVPFHWQAVDPNGLLIYGVSLSSGTCSGGIGLTSAAVGGDVCGRISEFVSYAPLGVPTQDGVTTAASVNMVQ